MSLHKKGFTLIELLVVIAIIGMLSSIVFASLNTARIKARESFFKQEIIQLSKLMHLEYADSGNYGNLSTGGRWVNDPVHVSAVSCDTAYPLSSTVSKYIAQANALCKKITKIGPAPTGYALYVTGNTDTFSVQGYLYNPGELIYCIGSSGRTTFGKPYAGGAAYSEPGCSSNP